MSTVVKKNPASKKKTGKHAASNPKIVSDEKMQEKLDHDIATMQITVLEEKMAKYNQRIVDLSAANLRSKEYAEKKERDMLDLVEHQTRINASKDEQIKKLKEQMQTLRQQLGAFSDLFHDLQEALVSEIDVKDDSIPAARMVKSIQDKLNEVNGVQQDKSDILQIYSIDM